MKWTDVLAFTIACVTGLGLVALAVVAWSHFKVDACLATGIGLVGLLFLGSIDIKSKGDSTGISL